MDLAVAWLAEKLTPVAQNFLQVARDSCTNMSIAQLSTFL